MPVQKVHCSLSVKNVIRVVKITTKNKMQKIKLKARKEIEEEKKL
jgi:hypothetical protein